MKEKKSKKEHMKNILAENLRRFKAKNLNEQGPKGNVLAPPAGATEIVPYKVQKGDTLSSIAKNWLVQNAQLQNPTDKQIMNFVKDIVSTTNQLKKFNLNIPGADAQINDPNLITPNMTLMLPKDKAELMSIVNK